MTPEQVDAILRDFAARAKLLRGRAGECECWRFEVDGKPYDLYYYPDDGTAATRRAGTGRAAREFASLQTMQKRHVPARRVIANLKGFRIADRKGDATILVHDPAVRPLLDLLRAGMSRDDRLKTLASLIALLEALHREKLCPVPLTLEVFARRGDGTVIVADGAGRFDGAITSDRLLELDAATRAATTVGERLRVWRHFVDAPAPRSPRRHAHYGRRLARAAERAEDDAFGTILFARGDERWVGRYLRSTPLALPWSRASRMAFSRDDWLAALPKLLDDRTSPAMKADDAAVVRGGAIDVGDERIDLVVKRPAVKPGLRGTFDLFRPARVRRTWGKTWRMLGLGFRCEVPLLVLERRRGLALVDQLLVVERVPGPTFAEIDLAALSATDREQLFYATGRVLRQIAAQRFTHRDAKHTNWIAWTDPAGDRLRPILIDLDGIRFVPFGRRAGIDRLIRAMRTRAETTDADVAAMESGFATRGE